MKVLTITLLALTFINATVIAQEQLTEHTYHLPNDMPLGKGQLKDVEWLVGSWQGTAFGGQFEEVWNPASAGTMMGMWKLYDAEKGVNFYELMLIKEEEDDGLVLLVKHFGADFIAWEEKDDFVKFRLVKIEEKAVHFSGLSFYQESPDKINGYIVMNHKDGSKTEHQMTYKRVKNFP